MTRYIRLGEYFWLAEQVTGINSNDLSAAARIELADSALHAPQAGFEGHEFYPELLEKAAVLVCRLAWNHPLPDGNKRAAWAAMAMFLDLNDVDWNPDSPQVDEAEAAMVAIAAEQVDQAWVATWLRGRTHPRESLGREPE
ncbi:Fic family protein [Dermatophilaceae bacterium Sec6.4]